MYKNYIKPGFDILFGLIGIIIFFPFFLIIFFLLVITLKGNPFFLQLRPGKNEKLFYMIKFKTMNDMKDESGNFLPDEERITKIGEFLRKTSLDEIPQFINILKGDISLIGPRPLLMEYLPLYNEFQKRRHLVKPGITGWAQVNGRNLISWSEKFALDVWYVDNISFLLDLKILGMTIIKVLKSEGISSGNSVTMEIFTGNESF